MNETTETGEPFFIGGIIGGPLFYGLALYFCTLILIFIIYFTAYICKWKMHPPSPRFTTHADHHCISITEGLRDDILATFPTFPYSEIVMPTEGHTHTVVRHINSHNSGCPICLADYKPTDFLRLLPECGHLFHMSCIDTWLKVHSTCPMCRNAIV